MGQIIASCKLNCCTDELKKDVKNTRSSFYSDSDRDDNEELAQIEYSRYCVTETPRTAIEFPVKLKNLFFEHFSNPWSTYIELKDIGEGAYGVVKKVCLKSDPDNIRAMKIIPKENIVENEDGSKFVDEI